MEGWGQFSRETQAVIAGFSAHFFARWYCTGHGKSTPGTIAASSGQKEEQQDNKKMEPEIMY
jgi:hypothetical protein